MWFWEKMALSILLASLPQVIIIIIIVTIIIIIIVISDDHNGFSGRNPSVRGQPKDRAVFLAEDRPARFPGITVIPKETQMLI